ncbi:uncharacterized protein LOC119376977 [Rhipicephalus sanguineus]|uniref:uncharacterized protein LOC119376977 n=1 Tax=Rhipicephalus sanguineus TaxID=34632 RepID=UPI001892F4C3|nr:uncharacterized protein LOC119376977 [Rhipicephalus sanguineus]
MAAVERFLDQSVVKVRNAEVKFEYRGVRVKTVRVLGYPADASDSALLNGLAAYGKVLGMDYEHVPEFKTVLTGNRRVRVEMARPVPNLLPVGSRIVQCEYDGVVRLCRRCFFPGHHAADCKVPQCERCAEFGHARCEAVCKRCGDDHALSACKVTSGAAEGQEAPSKGPEGSPLPETEPVRAEAPGGRAGREDQGETMDAEPWRLVRGKRRRARSSDSSDERPAAACGGPGDLEEGLPGVKRTAAADSDSESTSPPSRAVPRDLGGSEWDAVKASVAECFREWGKRRHARSGAEIKIVSDAILLLSKPLSVAPE